MTISITVDAPTAAEIQYLASIGTALSSGGVAGPTGTSSSPGPTIDYFPSNPAQAPFPSPENSTITGSMGADGVVTISGLGGDGTPLSGANAYLRDSSGNTWTLLPEQATSTTLAGKKISYADLTQYVQFPVTMNGTIIWSASSLIVRQGNVYLHDGQGWDLVNQGSSGGIKAGSLPPAWVASSGTGSTGTTEAPPLPDLPPASPVIGGSNSTTITVGPGLTYTTINAGMAAAGPGDTVLVNPGTYIESIGGTAAVLLMSSVPAVLPGATGAEPTLNAAAHAVIDVTTIPSASTFEQKGAVIPKADGFILDGFEIVGAGMDQTTSGMTSGVRVDAAGNYVLRNLYVHGCQDGIAASMSLGEAAVTLDTCYIADCGIADGLSHNVYIGDVAGLTVTDVVSTSPTYAHAFKTRAYRLSMSGFWGDAPNASVIDVPQGTGTEGTITDFVMTKNATDANHAILSYAEESTLNGTAGLELSNGTIVADCTSPFIQTSAGTITIDSTVSIQTTGTITVSGGGSVTGL